MERIEPEKRRELAALLDTHSQEEVMALIPQFYCAETGNFARVPGNGGPGCLKEAPSALVKSADEAEMCTPGGDRPYELGVLMFNMERGVHLKEIRDFLKASPDIQPFDVILANELDDGCYRSGNLNTALELAGELGLNYAWGLEFIELVDERNERGYHGNAVFSGWPIVRAGVIRLPEQYNWYFDRQRRIGGRLAVYAELDFHGRPLGVVSIHLENRTHGEGRMEQMKRVLDAVDEELKGMPVILGGDLNTNTFDGRDTEDIGVIAGSPELRRRCLEGVFEYEPLLPLCRKYGYEVVPREPKLTRRKPLPDGSFLPLRLDWILLRDVWSPESRMVSTAREDLGFAEKGSALELFSGKELSDHNAVWARCRLGTPQQWGCRD